MTGKERKIHLAREIIGILMMLMGLCFVCRLWPILLLMILGVFAAALRLLFLTSQRERALAPLPPLLPAPVTQPTAESVVDQAFSVILNQVTALVTEKYPEARWVWEQPDAKERISSGDDVFILLNRAGGYRRAKVVLRNLRVLCVQYEGVENSPAERLENTSAASDAPKAQDYPVPENYELLAFEWAEDHILELNERCNQAIGQGADELILPSSDLPVKESWPDICEELRRSGLEEVVCLSDGIKIKITQGTAERE